MKNKAVLFVIYFFIWCLLTWVPDWQHLVAGIFAAGFVALFTGELFKAPAKNMGNMRRYGYFIFEYVPHFLWECIKANIDVMYRVAHPALPIKPGIVKIKTNLKSYSGLTFLANSITLTPGTLTVDIDKDNGFLYIHWIDVTEKDVEEATKTIADKFEKMLVKIFE